MALLLAALLTTAVQGGPPEDVFADPEDVFADRVRPFLERHCFECHGTQDDPEADFSLAGYADENAVRADAAAWGLVADVLRYDEMPPLQMPRPDAAQATRVVAWIDGLFGERIRARVDPGRVTLRRLNRLEYENTILDLVGVEFPAAGIFPADGVGHGFDNIGDVLSMSDILLEKYLDAAERIAAEAIVVRDPDAPRRVRVDAANLVGDRRFSVFQGARSMHTEGTVSARLRIRTTGSYVMRVRAFGKQAGPELVRMRLLVDERRVGEFEVAAVRAEPGVYEAFLDLERGEHAFGAAFTNDYYKPDDLDPESRDRNMYVEWIELEGPTAEVLPAFQREYLAAAPSKRSAVERLATRAYRRPVRESEVTGLIALSDEDASLEECVQVALTAILVSPDFLFRVEVDPEPDDPNAVHTISDYELASRLSYFLWSSMPDDELFELSRAGDLHDADVLAREVHRMLRHPRATALATSFANQWLQVSSLDEAAPDPRRFPGFDEKLREAMRLETEMFFEAVLREGRGLQELLDADFTFLNEALAQHYDFPGVRGSGMRRVAIPKGMRRARGGILTHASVLTVTSNPTRTSPVRRGKWVLESLLDSPPPAPPPGADNLPDERNDAGELLSVRERFERHRADQKCAVCHAPMDPLGFGLENYDAVGAWRTREGAFPVDSTGELPDGRRFEGPSELRAILTEGDAFSKGFTRKLLSYALGRGLTLSDAPIVEEILRGLPERPTLEDVIQGIVRSDAFRMRRGEERDA